MLCLSTISFALSAKAESDLRFRIGENLLKIYRALEDYDRRQDEKALAIPKERSENEQPSREPPSP